MIVDWICVTCIQLSIFYVVKIHIEYSSSDFFFRPLCSKLRNIKKRLHWSFYFQPRLYWRKTRAERRIHLKISNTHFSSCKANLALAKLDTFVYLSNNSIKHKSIELDYFESKSNCLLFLMATLLFWDKCSFFI